MSVVRSVVLFVLAGLCEIGGGYLVWQWLRNLRSPVWGALGGIVLVLYAMIPILQPSHFSRVYAAYGGDENLTVREAPSPGLPFPRAQLVPRRQPCRRRTMLPLR